MADLLKYKVVIVLEGNNVASGLKWALASNSVLVMPPPTIASWAMEELLEPWVHSMTNLKTLKRSVVGTGQLPCCPSYCCSSEPVDDGIARTSRRGNDTS